jgi:hypothetical protein
MLGTAAYGSKRMPMNVPVSWLERPTASLMPRPATSLGGAVGKTTNTIVASAIERSKRFRSSR